MLDFSQKYQNKMIFAIYKKVYLLIICQKSPILNLFYSTYRNKTIFF